ncbi:HdeD family acid-resistance protein [Nocardia cyriacigeorgica]|uniref:HdeD family acid-resistance protein n=2 Tax=Nocardia cyriacigeorgica TaxID=135487 RepID=A0A6P1CTW1_9NOCA|nr:HdeD family acid-resistance protein [Nocardia cyriacigeorgica]MBF6286370.1 HdeD family acid-resistance protein [Nocardia cyriacigeorgica]MBF6423292.1 HdeD family acid-resistance protein [Nocardia cyriacigeorgica]NEW33575.1 HdeD family acid-resistance protein [Nocardia cyriacigeorgica]CCF64038.1 putative membrane protein [Nocardia cyriacigeorgica GUH-2]BDT87691.1 membrane protein [Nocardia cyriacigeorgica]
MTTNIIPQGPVQALARAAWQSILVTGLLSVILGVLILVWPGKTLLVAGIIFGIYLVVSGLLQLVAAFAAPASAGMRVLYFISGVLSIVIGVFCFRDELTSLLLLGLWIGIGWLFRGVAVTMAAVSEPGLPGRGWQGFFGVITAIAGVVLIIWPVESVATLAWVAGIWLVVLGVMEMITAFGVRKDAKDLGVPAQPVA